MSRSGLGAEYWKLWTASAVSNLGDGVARVAAPLLAASLTREPLLVAGLAFAQWLPWLLFALVSGALVDRLDRRQVMWTVDLFRTALIGALGIAVLGGWASMPLLYVVFFLLGTAETLFDTASQTILPQVVPEDRLEKANGRLYSAELVPNNFTGPPLGGFLFGVAAALPFLIDAGSFAVAAALVLALRGKFRPQHPENAPQTTLRAEIGEGLRWLWGHRVLRTLAAMVGAMNMLGMAAFATFVLFVQDVLGLGNAQYGFLLTSGAAGGLLGSLVADRIVGRLGTGKALFGVLLLNAGTFAVIASSPSSFLVAGMLALGALASVIWNVITVSFRQAVVPEQLLGRVNSAYRLMASGATALGAPLGGFLAQRYGLTAPFWIATAALVVVTVAALPVINERTIREARGAKPLATGLSGR